MAVKTGKSLSTLSLCQNRELRYDDQELIGLSLYGDQLSRQKNLCLGDDQDIEILKKYGDDQNREFVLIW